MVLTSAPPKATMKKGRMAMKSMIAYAGRYEFRGDHVLHHVTLSSFPNWVGTSQKRHVRLDGDRMTLSTDPIAHQGREVTASLVWERVPEG